MCFYLTGMGTLLFTCVPVVNCFDLPLMDCFPLSARLSEKERCWRELQHVGVFTADVIIGLFSFVGLSVSQKKCVLNYYF